jgi:hypothetical protein
MLRDDLGATALKLIGAFAGALFLLAPEATSAATMRTIEVLVLPGGRICLDGGPAFPLLSAKPAFRELMRGYSRDAVHITIAQGTSQATAHAVRVALQPER